MNRQEQDDKFSLYTEKIVVSPKVKYKRLIRLVKLLLCLTVLVVAGTLAYLFIFPKFSQYIKKNSEKREELTIEKDEYTPEEETEDDLQAADIKTDYETALNNLAGKISEIQKSVVVIDTMPDRDFSEEGSDENKSVGLIVAHTSTEYLIVTDYEIAQSSAISVRVSAESEASAIVLSRDEDLGLCVLSVRNMDVSYNNQENLKAAVLDNSYVLKKGDMVIAAGRIYGVNNSVDYGTITNITSMSGTDNAYEVLETNIKYQTGDYGFIFNSDGNAVGITAADEDGEVNVLGISGLKPLLELMINDEQVRYFGIKGQNIDTALSAKYGLPTGVYITDVERESPAYEAGLQSGDVIVSFNGNLILTIQSFSEKLYRCEDNQNVYIGVKRLGKDGYTDILFVVTVKNK